nr:hypothetical protein [Zobellella iuensis]
MAEQGIDGSGLYSKSWEQLAEFRPDLVITVCDQAAGESCPLWFGQAVKAHWGLTDPSRLADDAAARRGFERLATLLSERIRGLLAAEAGQRTPEQLQDLINRLG